MKTLLRVMSRYRKPFVWRGNSARQTFGEEYWSRKHSNGTVEVYKIEEHGFVENPGRRHLFDATQLFYEPGQVFHSNGQFLSGQHDYDRIAKTLRSAKFKRSRKMPELPRSIA